MKCHFNNRYITFSCNARNTVVVGHMFQTPVTFFTITNITVEYLQENLFLCVKRGSFIRQSQSNASYFFYVLC